MVPRAEARAPNLIRGQLHAGSGGEYFMTLTNFEDK